MWNVKISRRLVRLLPALFLGSILAPAIPLWATPQPEAGADRTARSIRVRKLAQDLSGQVVTLTLEDGTRIVGKLVEADFQRFVLIQGDMGRKEVPIDMTVTVTLSPGTSELLLTAVSGLLGGAFGSALMALSSPDADVYVKLGAGIVGIGLGGWLGFKSFYQEEVIELD